MSGKPPSAMKFSPRAADWLETAVAPRVLHVFAEACNLAEEQGRVMSLVDDSLGPGPFALVVAGGRPFTDWVDVDSTVQVKAGDLWLAGRRVDMSRADGWQPVPDWHLLREEPSRLSRFTNLIQKLLAAYDLPDTAVTPYLNQKLANAEDKIQKGMAGNDLAVWPEVAGELAGLGQGLTPTGDDFLMGVMFGLWATQAETAVRVITNQIKETAVPRTTTLSAAWLQAAADGEAGQPWHALVDSLVVGWGHGVEQAIGRILATGHSSGADALRGFTAVVT